MFRSVLTGLAALIAPVFLAAVLGLGLTTFTAGPAAAQHKMDPDDMELPIDDPKVVELGKEKYAQRCSFCHGGGGKGGKGPCLTCGKFTYSGNRNANIYAVIAGGINNRSLGGTMGAFGTTMSMEEITAVLTYMRFEERRRVAAGEITPPER